MKNMSKKVYVCRIKGKYEDAESAAEILNGIVLKKKYRKNLKKLNMKLNRLLKKHKLHIKLWDIHNVVDYVEGLNFETMPAPTRCYNEYVFIATFNK